LRECFLLAREAHFPASLGSIGRSSRRDEPRIAQDNPDPERSRGGRGCPGKAKTREKTAPKGQREMVASPKDPVHMIALREGIPRGMRPIGVDGLAPALRDGGVLVMRFSQDFILGYFRFVPTGRNSSEELQQERRRREGI